MKPAGLPPSDDKPNKRNRSTRKSERLGTESDMRHRTKPLRGRGCNTMGG